MKKKAIDLTEKQIENVIERNARNWFNDLDNIMFYIEKFLDNFNDDKEFVIATSRIDDLLVDAKDFMQVQMGVSEDDVKKMREALVFYNELNEKMNKCW